MENYLKVTMPAPQSPLVQAIAYFRHSAHDPQENWIAIQKDQARQWALENGVEIIREFCDFGQSGFDFDERPVFKELMEEWIKQRSDFEYILCCDASRWGRFPGSDHSKQSSEICQKHNKQVIYTSVGKPR